MNTAYPSKDWKALHDFMPGSPPTLRVTGKVTVPTTGFTATLTPAEPQGINPSIYLFNLTVYPPETDEVIRPTVTDLPVEYIEDTGKSYQQVQIRPEDILVDVEVVH